MKQRVLFILLYLLIGFQMGISQGREGMQTYNILLTGASFASPENGWFEIACRELGANPLNRAIGGEAIANAANRMAEGSLYTREELENLDVLVIMHAHNQDVFESSRLKDDYHDYSTPFDRSNYASEFDYVIKRYISECYELKNDPESRYYKTQSGKPVIVVLCTDWHDGRVVYNASIRELAEKWGFPLVEFDLNIGFSRKTLHPVTKKQFSLLYTTDTQQIDGETFGWHPARGENSYIQQRMAAIFAETMKKVLPLKPIR